MKNSQAKKGYLILQDGTVFEGTRFGADTDTIGELVFTTGMGAYVETLTDQSFYGQIIMQTFPLIGNYGIMEEDFEGDIAARGYIVRDWCDTPSNFRCEYDLDKFLRDKGIPGLSGIDTRELTRKLRDEGVMNAKICSSIPDDILEGKSDSKSKNKADSKSNVKAELENYIIKDAVDNVSCKEEYRVSAQGEKKYSVTLIDYGAKRSIAKNLANRGCEVRVVPTSATASDILSADPDGIVLSNGPGNPEDNAKCVKELKKLINKKPIFGIGLGHQLLVLAFGGKTYKLKYGHRGANQPVSGLDIKGNPRTFITTQNHGYAVDSETLKGEGVETFTNANDGTCEGIEYTGRKCFSVQFQPEAREGQQDTGFLYDKFIDMMEEDKNA